MNQHLSGSVLIVEDEINLGETLYDFLESKGLTCYHAQSIKSAKSILSEHSLDIILMDIGLPDGSGIDFAKEIKTKGADKELIIIFLSALNDPETKFMGLSIGGDDYLTKPFDVRELLLRLERVMESKNKIKSYKDEVVISGLRVWFKSFEVEDGAGKRLPLSQKECAILELLYSNIDIVISRDQIIEKVWGKNSFPSNRTVDNYIVSLRKWLETASEQTTRIASIRGIGYKLETIKN